MCPLGNEYPPAVFTLIDFIPSYPIGLGNLTISFIIECSTFRVHSYILTPDVIITYEALVK